MSICEKPSRVVRGTALGAGLLLLQTLAAAPSYAQQPADEGTQAPVAAQDRETKDVNRVLYLVGGATVRSRARKVDDHWEYRRGGDWAALPSGAVERVAEERDLLAQAAQLERGLTRNDTTRRVALADWMFRAGLLDEALGQLDRVLAIDPDQKDALALLDAPPAKMRIPGEDQAEIADAVKAAANVPAALSELAIRSLGARPDKQAVTAQLGKALWSSSPRMRSLGARALRRLAPGEEVRSLIARAVLDGTEDVRREAALTLGAVNEAAVAVPVIKALGSETSVVRTNAVEALGNMGYPAAVYPLINRLAAINAAPQGGGGWSPPGGYIFVGRQFAYVQDFDVEVAQFAAVADPVINTAVEGSVLDARVVGVYQINFAVESRAVRSSLAKLTGADPGNSNKAWLDWWDQHKSEYQPKQPGTATASATSTPPPEHR